MSAGWQVGVMMALALSAGPIRADAASDRKEAELDRVPEEWREVAQLLADIDRSDASIPWTELRDFKNQYHHFRPTPCDASSSPIGRTRPSTPSPSVQAVLGGPGPEPTELLLDAEKLIVLG
ncbi:MAG: hypothetical protein U0840_09230 [Gemmataceae bacterium]